MLFKKFIASAAVILAITAGSTATADVIYVVGDNHSSTTTAVNHLTSLGHSVTYSATPLNDYSGYDQVWDLRYFSNVPSAERTVWSNFLASGGGLYISGENATFDVRNNAVNVFLSEIGAGAVGLVDSTSNWNDQTITAGGQVVNSPNTYSTVTTYFGRTVTAPGTGFLVAESQTAAGTGSLVGWDFGDLPNHANARMLVGYDIELFDNGIGWTENVATYLGATGIPEPGSTCGAAILAVALSLLRRRGRKSA